MTSWGIATTVKNPEDHLLAFIAHHLALGAAQLWLYFDDPDDPAYDRISRLPKVTAIRCTDWYWLLRGGRRSEVPMRQIRNVQHAQRRCRLDWLGHIDIDEFLHAPRQVSEILSEIPEDVLNIRIEPFEAMHDPNLIDDIFTARQFRGTLGETYRDLHPAIFGRYASALSKGSLSHEFGKSFVRPRSRRVSLSLHDVLLDKIKVQTPFHPDLRLLHFHAQDPDHWRRALPFRLSGGAYFYESGALHALLSTADADELREFYATVMSLTPEKSALLESSGRLVKADLGLRAKVADLLAGRFG